MLVFSYLARLFLAGVFLIAGSSKLISGVSTFRKTLADFGVPKLFLVPFSFLLPIVELLIGCALLPGRFAWFGAIAAAALLLAFDAAIAANLAIGKHPRCNCFGQLHSEPIGWETFARNLALATLACLLIWEGRTQPGLSLWQFRGHFTSLEAGLVALAIAVCAGFAVGGFLLLHVFRQNGRLLLRIETLEANRALAIQPTVARQSGLPIGSLAPSFDLPNVNGGRLTLANFVSQGKALLLIFTDPNCGPCNSLMPDVAGWQKTMADELSIVLISSGRHKDNRAKATEYGLMNFLVETSKRSVANSYSALGTPTAVTIRQGGKVGSYPVGGADAIRSLVANKGWTEAGFATFLKASSQPQPQPTTLKSLLPVGSQAPAFTLPDLEGKTVESATFGGQETLLLFWNVGCGFCQRMLPQLIEWEKMRPKSAPRLVLVSSGSRETNAQMGLRSPIVLEENFAVGKLYGASGTPSALLIDAKGKIASRLAVGAPGVFDLLGAQKSDTDKPAVSLAAADWVS
jgi:peroxiredoxin/uncharacterized membrane protein YphA (DoxX/SURF4 family)